MFGNKNRMKPEEIQSMKETLEKREEFFKKVSSIRGMCEANISEIDNSRLQTKENLNQVNRNVDNAIAQSEESIEKQAALAGDLRLLSENLGQTNEEYNKLLGYMKEQSEAVTKLVDDNKHYTTPSKVVKEFPDKLEARMIRCIDYAAQMAEFRKQMGILALNSAIEAGRMGDDGKSFVDAAEEIRVYTSRFAGVVGSLEQELADIKKDNELLKAQVDKLVALLKDSNVSTVNLMKKCNESVKAAESINIMEYSEGVLNLKDKVVDIRNNQEEILKEEERNKMQIEDIFSELELQQNNEKELYGSLLPILEETK